MGGNKKFRHFQGCPGRPESTEVDLHPCPRGKNSQVSVDCMLASLCLLGHLVWSLVSAQTEDFHLCRVFSCNRWTFTPQLCEISTMAEQKVSKHLSGFWYHFYMRWWLKGLGISFGRVMKMFKNWMWWWLPNSANVLNTVELYPILIIF